MTEDLEDYLQTLTGLRSGELTEVDPRFPGDVQAFRDFATEATQEDG